jgi:hypothetical protein
MKPARLLAALIVGASVYATGPALSQDSRRGTLVQQDFSDCSNSNVNAQDPNIGGTLSVDRGADGNTHVRVSLRARPNTTYHFFLKCVRLLGDIATQDDGFAVANFDFPTNSAGDIFAFDMYPEGAPSGNKFQSFQVNFRDPQTTSAWSTFLPPGQRVSREVLLLPQDFSDCSNADVRAPDVRTTGGAATVDRGADGNTHVRANLSGRPNTTYHFFLKCVRQLGDLTTQANGVGIANFNFPTNLAGDVFAFDMYPEGAPLGNKYQSIQVDFRPTSDPRPVDPPPDDPKPITGPSARMEYLGQTATAVSIAYADMPEGTELILVQAMTGMETTSVVALSPGDRTLDFAIAADQAGGDYYLLARKRADKEYLARTIIFYIN